MEVAANHLEMIRLTADLSAGHKEKAPSRDRIALQEMQIQHVGREFRARFREK